MIKSEIVCDSINKVGNRLTTFILEYPRFVHAEFMTHRVFSRNAASSRAIPTEKIIQQIIDNPAMPVWWGKNQSGMQAKEELDDTIKRGYSKPLHNDYSWMEGHIDCEGTDRERAKEIWLEARDEAIKQVKRLNVIGLHKQIANRILEPWFNIRVICSATEYENFFALRVHPDAQPEIQELASQMLKLYNESTPNRLEPGEWHIPFGDKMDKNKLIELADKNRDLRAMSPVDDNKILQLNIDEIRKKIAIARCARISYFNFDGKDDYEADVKLCDRLFGNIPRHLSPTEHVAKSLGESKWSGNFCGFEQYRKTFQDENLKDSRVLSK